MTPREQSALVTGAAGFIGGHVSEALLSAGWRVTCVDAFTDFYDVARKRSTVALLAEHPRFQAIEADLATTDPAPLLADVDVVFHLAGQPGVRGSWEDGFGTYVNDNVIATQRLLEAARLSPIGRFVFSSSSSVYGNADEYPCTERTLPKPFSPYGVTKLAAEHLCTLYAETFGVPTVSLRYFSVYGPRQRPDMALSRIITGVLDGTPFPMYGSGEQVRDFTYVSDVVAATIAAGTAEVEPGTVLNVAGGSTASLRGLIDLVERLTEQTVPVEQRPAAAGDVQVTSGDSTAARSVLGWKPVVDLEAGVARQVESEAHRVATVVDAFE